MDEVQRLREEVKRMKEIPWPSILSLMLSKHIVRPL